MQSEASAQLFDWEESEKLKNFKGRMGVVMTVRGINRS